MHTNYECHITLNLEKDGIEEVENCLREMQYACFFFDTSLLFTSSVINAACGIAGSFR